MKEGVYEKKETKREMAVKKNLETLPCPNGKTTPANVDFPILVGLKLISNNKFLISNFKMS